jgi:hypothetical protein
MTARAPFASAAAMVDDARSTSITATRRPVMSNGANAAPPNTTSRRITPVP